MRNIRKDTLYHVCMCDIVEVQDLGNFVERKLMKQNDDWELTGFKKKFIGDQRSY